MWNVPAVHSNRMHILLDMASVQAQINALLGLTTKYSDFILVLDNMSTAVGRLESDSTTHLTGLVERTYSWARTNVKPINADDAFCAEMKIFQEEL